MLAEDHDSSEPEHWKLDFKWLEVHDPVKDRMETTSRKVVFFIDQSHHENVHGCTVFTSREFDQGDRTVNYRNVFLFNKLDIR